MTTPAMIEAQYRVLQALETAIYDLGPRSDRLVEAAHSGAVPDVVSEINLRRRRRRVVPLRAVGHAERHVLDDLWRSTAS